KCDADGRLHLLSCFSSPASGHDWAYGSADTAGGEQYADTGSGLAADGKNPLAENGKQGENSTANAPGWFDHQVSKDARPVPDVMRSFDGVCNTDGPSHGKFGLLAFRTFGQPDHRDQECRGNESQRVEYEGRVGAERA